jgi:hypothetical protein
VIAAHDHAVDDVAGPEAFVLEGRRRRDVVGLVSGARQGRRQGGDQRQRD